jgi:hypothetical protein
MTANEDPSPELPQIGQRIRFAIDYEGMWRPLGWIRTGKDGSIYVGTIMGKPLTAEELQKPAHGETTIHYDELRALETPPKSSRLSFHPSGEVHIGDKIVTGLVPLEKLHQPLQLCTFMFAHPRKYRPPANKNDEDFDVGIIGYQVDETCPMYGAIVVAPWIGQPQLPQKLPRMTHFVGTAIGLRGFTKTPDLLIAILIGHGPAGVWPDEAGVVVLSKAN